MPKSLKTRDLSAEEAAFVKSSIQVGQRVCDRYLGRAKRLVPPCSLDVAYEAWTRDTRPEKPSPNDICFGLGALLGDCVVTELGFRWRMEVADEGDEYCMLHPEEWRSYPFDFVGKRIHDREEKGGFFRALYDLLRDRRAA